MDLSFQMGSRSRKILQLVTKEANDCEQNDYNTEIVATEYNSSIQAEEVNNTNTNSVVPIGKLYFCY